jgi:hypothetical protein
VIYRCIKGMATVLLASLCLSTGVQAQQDIVSNEQNSVCESECQERISRFVKTLIMTDPEQPELLRFANKLYNNPKLANEFQGFDGSHLVMVNFESQVAKKMVREFNLDECKQIILS